MGTVETVHWITPHLRTPMISDGLLVDFFLNCIVPLSFVQTHLPIPPPLPHSQLTVSTYGQFLSHGGSFQNWRRITCPRPFQRSILCMSSLHNEAKKLAANSQTSETFYWQMTMKFVYQWTVILCFIARCAATDGYALNIISRQWHLADKSRIDLGIPSKVPKTNILLSCW